MEESIFIEIFSVLKKIRKLNVENAENENTENSSQINSLTYSLEINLEMLQKKIIVYDERKSKHSKNIHLIEE